MRELRYPGKCVVPHCETLIDCNPGRNRSFTRRCRACIKSMQIFDNMSPDNLDASELRATLILARINLVHTRKREMSHGVNNETVVVGDSSDDRANRGQCWGDDPSA